MWSALPKPFNCFVPFSFFYAEKIKPPFKKLSYEAATRSCKTFHDRSWVSFFFCLRFIERRYFSLVRKNLIHRWAGAWSRWMHAYESNRMLSVFLFPWFSECCYTFTWPIFSGSPISNASLWKTRNRFFSFIMLLRRMAFFLFRFEHKNMRAPFTKPFSYARFLM